MNICMFYILYVIENIGIYYTNLIIVQMDLLVEIILQSTEYAFRRFASSDRRNVTLFRLGEEMVNPVNIVAT